MTKPVLITTSIVVQVPDEASEDFVFSYKYGDLLSDAIKSAFRDTPIVEYPAALDFVWLDLEDVNVGRCEQCGCWVSDYTKPDELKGIPGGRFTDGKWLCDECETFGIDSVGKAVNG
jgi:hypothetical protein